MAKMKMSMDKTVELHSENCVCHGYAWAVIPAEGRPGRSKCCNPGEVQPPGAVYVPASWWRDLGMPRTAEKYAERSERLYAQNRHQVA